MKANPPLHRAKEIKIFVTFVTVFTPQSSRLGFACRGHRIALIAQKGFPMAKLIILAAFGFGIVGFGAAFPQWLAPQPCSETSCVIGP